MLELDDIQSIVFSGYKQNPFAAYLLLRVLDASRARAWLGEVSRDLTAGKAGRAQRTFLNIAITSSGLSQLGLPDDALSTFPLEFREGIAGSETRARTLGDVGPSEPSKWIWGGPKQPVDLMLMLYAESQASIDLLVASHEAGLQGALECVYVRRTQTIPERREHFGFADGISQVDVEGSSRNPSDGVDQIEAGEFVLGYENAYGKLPFVPNAAPALDATGALMDCQAEGERRALGRNGTYLVVRQLSQDVYGFWNAMREAAQAEHPASTASDHAVYLAAKCVGRWPSGAPLVTCPEQDDPSCGNRNDFGYFFRDRHGERCPIGSHIRRSNPRDSLEPDPFSSKKVSDRHRIIRRGRSYGPHIDKPWLIERDDGEDRGLFFVCVNANIRRQFEFIQQTWINNPKFGGLYDEVDPLVGTKCVGDENVGAEDGAANGFTIQGKPVRRRIESLPNFTTVRGAEYFFLPSVRALKFLAGLSPRQ